MNDASVYRNQQWLQENLNAHRFLCRRAALFPANDPRMGEIIGLLTQCAFQLGYICRQWCHKRTEYPEQTAFFVLRRKLEPMFVRCGEVLRYVDARLDELQAVMGYQRRGVVDGLDD